MRDTWKKSDKNVQNAGRNRNQEGVQGWKRWGFSYFVAETVGRGSGVGGAACERAAGQTPASVSSVNGRDERA